MKKTIAMALSSVFMLGQVHAAANVLGSDFSQFRKQMKKQGTNLTILNSVDTIGTTNKVNGLTNTIEILANQNLSENWDARLYPIIVTSRPEGQDDPDGLASRTSLQLLEVRLRRKNLLTEDANGINLNAQIRAAYNPDSGSRRAENNSGYYQGRMQWSKSFTDSVSYTGLARYYHFHSRGENQTQADTLKGLGTIYNAFDTALNDKWSFTHDFEIKKYLYDLSAKNGGAYNKVEWGETVTYAVSKDISLAAYVEWTPIRHNDGEKLAEEWFKQPTVGATITLNAF